MSNIAQVDLDRAQRLVNTNVNPVICYGGIALSPGQGAATELGQVAAALTYWTALQGAQTAFFTAAGQANINTAITDAISYLTALQTFLQNPEGGKIPPIR